MRKTLALVLSALMLVSLLCVPSFAAEGTPINTAAEFLAMDPAGTYYLNADITLTDRYGYVDDATTTPFTGTLDGNGHTITTSVCIFETLNGATIKNLTINGEVIIANGGTTGSGVLARNSKENGATLENIINNASLTIEAIDGAAYVGSLIGAVSKGDLKITNCVNNGKITAKTPFNFNGKTDVAPRFGGLTGNVAKGVVPVFTNCTNNGDIELIDTAETISTGSAYLGGISSDCFTGTFINCTNNGNLTANVKIDGGGICGRLVPSKQLDDHSVSFTNCVNNGDITTSANTNRAIGGIYGYANGESSIIYCMKIDHCLNTGDLSYTNESSTGNIGGLAGYLWGSGTNAYADVQFSINTGNITSAGPAFVSEFLGYSNSAGNIVANNIGLGQLSTGKRSVKVSTESDETTDVVLACMIGVSSADTTPANMQNNYIIETAGLNFFSYATDPKNAVRRIAIADKPEGTITFVTDAQVKSGEVTFLANSNLSEEVFYQTIGTDNIPVLDNTHGKVYKTASGGFTNNAAEAVTEAPTAAPTEAPTAAPTEAPTAAPTEAPTAAPTEAPTDAPANTDAPETKPAEEKKGCKSSVACGLVLVAILGTAYVSKKH